MADQRTLSKRQIAGKGIGSKTKFTGHAWEVVYNAHFNKREPINLSGKSQDCFVSEKKILKKLKKIGLKKHVKVSLKTGGTIQFQLGRLDELTDLKFTKKSVKNIKGETCWKYSSSKNHQLKVLKQKKFWNTHLNGEKGNCLCYASPRITWRHFNMNDVIQVITNHIVWNRKKTGRWIGKLPFLEPFLLMSKPKQKIYEVTFRAKLRSVITIELKKASLKFAAVGKNGPYLIQYLTNTIPYVDINQKDNGVPAETINFEPLKFSDDTKSEA